MTLTFLFLTLYQQHFVCSTIKLYTITTTTLHCQQLTLLASWAV